MIRKSFACRYVSASLMTMLLFAIANGSYGDTTSSVTNRSAKFSGDKSWTFRCDFDSNCVKKYPRLLSEIEKHLRDSSKMYESHGFGPGEFFVSKGRSKEGNQITGPTLFLFESSNPVARKTAKFVKGQPCRPVGSEIASYATGRKDQSLSTIGAVMLYETRAYHMFDSQYLNDPETMPCPSSSQKFKRLVDGLSHEAFHGYQKLRSKPGLRSDVLNWIIEASAEAGSYPYSNRIAGDGFGDKTSHYDFPLNDDYYEYERGHFFYNVGKKIDGANPTKWMTHLFDGFPDTANAGYDHVGNALNAATGNRRGLSGHFIDFIEKNAASKRFYSELAKPMTIPVRKEDWYEKDYSVAEMAAEGFDTKVEKLVVQEFVNLPPGENFVVLDFKIEPEAPKLSTMALILDREAATKENKKEETKLIATDGVPKEWFTRIVNAPRPSDLRKDQKAKYKVRTRLFRVSIPTCLTPGQKVELEFEPEKPDFDVNVRAQKGQISKNLVYTAPATLGSDRLEIELGTGKKAKNEFVVFAEPDIKRKGCQFKLKSSDGYVITFDPSNEMTKTVESGSPNAAYFDREFGYAFDNSTGWLKLRPSQLGILSASGSGKGFPSRNGLKNKLCDTTGPDPLKWGRAPYDFLIDLERPAMRVCARKNPGKIVFSKNRVPCPVVGGSCSVATINNGDKVYYDTRNRIVVLNVQGKTHTVEYGAFPIEKPQGAKEIKLPF